MLKKFGKFSLPEIEKQVLEFWKEHDIFQKSLEQTKKGKEFVFYEGPPTANGRPGIHHVLARAFKDAIPRYKTMRGFHVPRKGGWDTHGLPVEIEVEKELGLRSKQDIEKYLPAGRQASIAAFNKKCRESVWKYRDEWERLTERMGYWLDMKHPYVTYENNYISEVWKIVREAWKKKLLYKGHKVLPWCTRCGTALSSHELALGYKKVKENSIYIKFPLKEEKNTFILSWTTTPWTLPGNIALAIGNDIEYGFYENEGEIFVVAKDRAVHLGFKSLKKSMKGSELIDLQYKPLFEIQQLKSEKSYKIYAGDFVTTLEGTGVVHTSVMYGEDDYNLGKEKDLPQFHTVAEDGKFINSVPEVGGMSVKTKESDEKILKYLKKQGNYFKEELYEHDYPFCWRCSTPLLYYARASWFIKMSKLRKELIKNNKEINWIPEHIREGRFGEWLREAKDWAISRERYWGTPLPIWQCERCGKERFVSEEEDFVDAKTSSNTYIFMRHGESESNVTETLSSYPEKKPMPLTEKGIKQVEKAAGELKHRKIDILYASDITRAKQTADIISKTIDISVIHDERLRENNFGSFNGKSYSDYERLSDDEKFNSLPEGCETRNDIRFRMYDFLKDCEKKHQKKTILVVSHEDPIWMMGGICKGYTSEEVVSEWKKLKFDLAEFREFEWKSFPRNEFGIKDFHKPFIDEISFFCECGGEMQRTSEVLDVWFDSGSMPWAQNTEHGTQNMKYEAQIGYPADYIAEAVDQTRGWFYTLLAIGTFLGKEAPYKNVICLGHILDSKGQKMSKSKGNVVNPWEVIEKHGSDAIRWHFYTVNSPGESKKFDERELVKVSRAIFMILYNSWAFWDLYADKTIQEYESTKVREKKNILDKWILARLDETAYEMTELLDRYEIGKAAKSAEKLINDLSRWYIRRSRRRFQKVENEADFKEASVTLGYVLSETAKLLAPFLPFFAEALHKSFIINNKQLKTSVHLEEWPKPLKLQTSTSKLLEEMEEVRKIASAVLAKRAELGIKVRQPLEKLKIKREKLKEEKLAEILKDEVNVKNILFGAKIENEIELDTNITQDLKEEGILREILRAMQEFRQEKGLIPKDRVAMRISADAQTLDLIKRNEAKLLKEANASEFNFEERKGEIIIS